MRSLTARPLTADAFAPYGEVLEAPRDFGRTYIEGALSNGRSDAQASLSFSLVKPAAALPLVAHLMERHEFSSQSFVPMEDGRFLVVVAPRAPGGGPDLARVEAFVARPGQGITYGMNVWHHPMTALDRPMRFAIFMWLERSATDEEFFTLPEPIEVRI